MKVSLLLPPYFPADAPYLSLPALAACLRTRGIHASCRDLNLEMWELLLSEAGSPGDLGQRGERAREILQSEEAFDIFRYMEAITSIEAVWKRLSEGLPGKITWREYHLERRLQEIGPLVERVKEGPVDLFSEPFDTQVRESVLRESDIVGFSIAVPQQIVPAMEMAYSIKREAPDTFVVFGGAYITHLSVFDDIKHLSPFCDCVSIFEGEESLPSLVEYKEGQRKREEVPNVLWFSGDHVRELFADIQSLPLPDYSVVPLHRYLSPQVVLPYLSSRGCPWHSCRFCPLHFSYGDGFRDLPVERVVEDIRTIQKKWNIHYLSFVDLSLPSDFALQLSEALIAQGISISMKANMRFEVRERSFYRTLREAGFRILSFGLESYNDRVLNAMHKGIDTATIQAVLQASAESDIWNHVYFMTGFPTETEEDIKTTRAFITENPHLFGTTDHMRFELYYPALEKCQGLVTEVKRKPGIMGLAYTYRGEGVTQERATALDAEAEREIRKTLPQHWIAQTLTHEMLLLYVAKYGLDLSPSF